MEVNLLGDGCAYAIVCEHTGCTSMDLLFHCVDLGELVQPTDKTSGMMERPRLLSAEFLLLQWMRSYSAKCNVLGAWKSGLEQELYCLALVSS